MNDERLSKAILGAMTVVVALMLEASHRLRNRSTSAMRMSPDVVVLEEPEPPEETTEGQ
ncbi:hypothetical protein HALLA_09645 [Halostagnicola larsenii XH-48]|uniref:Uncharacterized protein n=1 Tax=Halostagnicola larsenii XH-48 TaxID=797299 RepID=W0JU81_9EURY|nr:hypothetical protein [Halostagnicola larsenii]AHG00833.1 hypothetical protein HALLA_09480 [Halostagnicola larsenii XH-48]AHG00852.1 hypothetical protein HALLA_09645 [Halostagnicola larsenii XH-48]